MSSTPNRLAGIAYVTVDGTTYQLVGDLNYRVSTVSRETLTGQDTVHGFSEKPVAGFISGKFRDSGGLSVAAFNAMDGVTVMAELNNGKLIVGQSMWTVEDQTVNTEDGSFEVRWESQSVTEN